MTVPQRQLLIRRLQRKLPPIRLPPQRRPLLIKQPLRRLLLKLQRSRLQWRRPLLLPREKWESLVVWNLEDEYYPRKKLAMNCGHCSR